MVQSVPGVSAPNARAGMRRATSSVLNASPRWAPDCSIRSPSVEPDRTAVAATTTSWCALARVNDVAVSLMIVPVAPTRSRRMIRAGFPTAEVEAAHSSRR